MEHYQRRLENFPGDLAMHNVFDEIMTNCSDEKILAVIRERFDHVFMIARELNVKTIVSHFNWRAFYDGPWLSDWQDKQVRFWERYVDLAEKHDLLLVMENTTEIRPDILKGVIDKMDSKRYRIVMDVGHANIFSTVPVNNWPAVFGEDLVYMHVHNNDGTYDAHNSVLNGTVNYDSLLDCIDDLGIKPVLSTEITDMEPLLESVDYLQNR